LFVSKRRVIKPILLEIHVGEKSYLYSNRNAKRLKYLVAVEEESFSEVL